MRSPIPGPKSDSRPVVLSVFTLPRSAVESISFRGDYDGTPGES